MRGVGVGRHGAGEGSAGRRAEMEMQEDVGAEGALAQASGR